MWSRSQRREGTVQPGKTQRGSRMVTCSRIQGGGSWRSTAPAVVGSRSMTGLTNTLAWVSQRRRVVVETTPRPSTTAVPGGGPVRSIWDRWLVSWWRWTAVGRRSGPVVRYGSSAGCSCTGCSSVVGWLRDARCARSSATGAGSVRRWSRGRCRRRGFETLAALAPQPPGGRRSGLGVVGGGSRRSLGGRPAPRGRSRGRWGRSRGSGGGSSGASGRGGAFSTHAGRSRAARVSARSRSSGRRWT